MMYDSRQLTDVCITVDNQQFHCHRAVLAASSCYFHAMLTTGLAESRQSDIELHEVDAESVKALIDYAYTGSVPITPLNVQNLIVTASLFQVNRPVNFSTAAAILIIYSLLCLAYACYVSRHHRSLSVLQ